MDLRAPGTRQGSYFHQATAKSRGRPPSVRRSGSCKMEASIKSWVPWWIDGKKIFTSICMPNLLSNTGESQEDVPVKSPQGGSCHKTMTLISAPKQVTKTESGHESQCSTPVPTMKDGDPFGGKLMTRVIWVRERSVEPHGLFRRIYTNLNKNQWWDERPHESSCRNHVWWVRLGWIELAHSDGSDLAPHNCRLAGITGTHLLGLTSDPDSKNRSRKKWKLCFFWGGESLAIGSN